jgi:CBS domain-containing protein
MRIFMGTVKLTKKEFPSVLDSAYEQYKRNLEEYKLVEDIMSKNVQTVTPETTMAKAAKEMGEKHIGSLIVTIYETPVGIVTERDLLNKVLLKDKKLEDVTVEDCMSYPLIKVCNNTKIKDAAKMMIEQKGRLAVFQCGALLGVVTASDLIKSLPEVSETEVIVDDFMSKPVIAADESTAIKDVAKMMGKQRIGSVIVIKDGIPKGIFTERDLLTSILAKKVNMNELIEFHCSSPLVTLPSGRSIHDAAAVMSMKHIRRLPIVKKGKILGMVTARDLVEAYSK